MAAETYGNTSRSTFAADVEQWVKDSEAAMLGVMRASIDDAVQMSQTPKARGGHMPVDTGFLRSTGLGSLNGWPSGPSDKPEGAAKGSFKWDGKAVTATLAAMSPGDTFHFGWTAVYALRQETYNGFVGTTAQKWQSIVNANIRKLKNG